MARCLKCGENVDECSIFCQNCGSKIRKDNSFEDKKNNAMIVFGYLTLIIQVISLFVTWYHLKVINADRIVLYPLLCVMLSFFIAFYLVKNEKTFNHGIIVVFVSVILFVLCVAGV